MKRQVYIIDDEQCVRDSLIALLSTYPDLQLEAFASGNKFFDSPRNSTGDVVLLDLHMPGWSGLEVLRLLKSEDIPHEVIVLTGQGDIAMAVEAMKCGASDFLEKPYDHEKLGSAIQLAFEKLADALLERKAKIEAKKLLNILSRREREVLDYIVNGKSNKIVASELGLSIRTIEQYRLNLLNKLGVRTLHDAVHLVSTAGC